MRGHSGYGVHQFEVVHPSCLTTRTRVSCLITMSTFISSFSSTQPADDSHGARDGVCGSAGAIPIHRGNNEVPFLVASFYNVSLNHPSIYQHDYMDFSMTCKIELEKKRILLSKKAC